MRTLAFFITLFPLFTWAKIRQKKEIFISPKNLFTIIYIISTLIPILLYINGNNSIMSDKIIIQNSISDNNIYLKHAVLQTLGYYLVIFGMSLSIKTKYRLVSINQNKLGQNFNSYKYFGIFIWLIGFISFILVMRRAGGIVYFVTHLQNRIEIFKNIKFFPRLLILMEYGVLLYIYSNKGSNKDLNWKLLLVIIASGVMSGLGGRKALIMLLLQSLAVQHYCVKKIHFKKYLKFRNLFLIIAVYLYFILFRLLRNPDNLDLFLSEPFKFFIYTNTGLVTNIRSESYVSHFMALVKYFDNHKYWYGKTFLALIYAWIPSSIYLNKPPVDDGTYLYSICLGREDIDPPMPFSNLNGSSYPLETFGSMYGNFGYLGLLIGMILLGMIYNYAFKKMKNSNFELFYLFMYIYIIFGFHLSTLRIVQIISRYIAFKIITILANNKITLRK